ncbi:MAG TPA: lantibiotic dehydratase, partial [Anaeromyxobacter sp.]
MPDASTKTAYELADLFQIRMAGVPYDVLEPLATPRAIALARELGAQMRAVDAAARAALEVLRAGGGGLADPDRQQVRNAIGKRLPPGELPAGAAPELAAYGAALQARDAIRTRHDAAAVEELASAARALDLAARTFMPDYSVFMSAPVEELAFDDDASLPDGGDRQHESRRPRRWRAHLLLYVQRLATKNETLSAFGPSGWGTVDRSAKGLRLEPRPGLRRHAFLERGVADAVVAAMNRDPAVRPEIAPRLHPAGRLAQGEFVRLDTGARLPLDGEARALAARCDGRTPAHALAGAEGLGPLAEAGVVLWAAETPRYVVDRVGELHALVARWREGEPRRRWEAVLSALREIPPAFERETDPVRRRALVQRVRAILAELGAPTPAAGPAQRTLYRASNPIAEECDRDCGFVLGGDAAAEVTRDAAPWLDLWRDVFAFAASRANAKLAALHSAAGPKGGAVPLPAYLAAAESAGLPLTLNGVPGLAFMAFMEVKAAFARATAGREEAREWTLTADDCAFLRKRFEFPRFEPFTFPSADLQLAARSAAEVAEGKHRWVVAELHLPAVAMQHAVYWACPDPARFERWLRAMAGGPFADWGFLPADLTNHTLLHFEAAPDLWTYSGPGTISPRWRSVRPADVEVVVADGDVRMRAEGRDLGSFARSWVLALGFHPFVLTRAPHTPRLVIGRTVLQRETWVVGKKDLPRARYGFGSADLALDVERLRAARGLPRYVYVRPTDEAVRRLGAGGRDKDVKPVFVDLESYPFLDILARWMAKHGELEVVEMLPSPEELPWREADGRRTFELRTLVAPRGAG